LIEEFYPVDEISITAWVKEGRAHVTCIYDVNRNFGEDIVLSSVRFPSKYTNAYLPEFKKLTQELTDSFGVKEGPITVQCYIGDKGLKIGEYLYRLAGGSPYLYPTLTGGPNIARILTEYQAGKPIDYQNLEEYSPAGEGWYYDVLVCAKQSGKIYYDITEEGIMQSLKACKKLIVYHESVSELSHVPKAGKPVMRLFYYQEEKDKRSYKEILDEIAQIIRIRDEQGEDITELRYPRKNTEKK